MIKKLKKKKKNRNYFTCYYNIICISNNASVNAPLYINIYLLLLCSIGIIAVINGCILCFNVI